MLVTIIVFLFILSVLIMAHELGHFLMARRVGIKVEEFGLGYPPQIWSKKIGETVYSINLLPIGGFVRLLGEEGPAESKRVKERESKNAFWAKSKKARTAVIVSGVLANFLLAVVVFSIVYSVVGIPTKSDQVMVLGVVPGSPADQAGLKEEDVVIKVEGQEVKKVEEFVEIVDENKGKEIAILVERECDRVTPCQEVFHLVPREEPPEGEGALGVIISNIKMFHYPFWQMPFRGIIEGFKEAFGWATLVVGGLGQIIYRLVTTREVADVAAGPVGILQLTSGAAKGGVLMVLQFLGMLSINLTVINILPFPALDGGRLLFVGIEAVTGKRPKATFERWVHTIGMIILLFLLLLVTINDIARVFRTSGLVSQLRSVWPF